MALPWGSRSTTRTRWPCERQIGRQIDHRRGLADAALLVGAGDRLAHSGPRSKGAHERRILPSGGRSHSRGPVFGVVLPILTVVALRTLIAGRRGRRRPRAWCCTWNSPGPRHARLGLRHARDTHACPRPCMGPCERDRFHVARAAATAGRQAVRRARRGPAKRTGACSTCNTLRRGSGLFPHRNGLGILLHDVAALGRRGRSRIRRAAGHKAEVRLSRCV